MEIKESLKSFIEYIERNLDTDYCVVGSLALQVCGFPINREPHDIDIEVIGNDKVKAVMEALSESNSSKSTYSPDPNRYDFVWNDTIVNVWIVDKLEKQFVWKDYIKYATIQDVIKEKIKYKRLKDTSDILYAFNKLIN